MPKPPTILFCNCAHGQFVPGEVRRAVLATLCEAGVAFEVVADLCALAARRDPRLRRLGESSDIRIAACFPRAVRWLFHAAGADLPAGGVTIANMRTQPADEVAERLLAGLEPPAKPAPPPSGPLDAAPGEWVPWFPVVDYDRCQGCKQCLSFCLFGVYTATDDGRVRVQNPRNCKTYCPACARICPQAAIIFPKYKVRPFNGDEVRPDDLQQPAVNVDVTSLVAGDVYDKLRQRSGARPGDPEQLAQLKDQLDIPDDVMDSLRARRKCDKQNG